MPSVTRALLVAVVLAAVAGAPVFYLLPADPMVRAPFVPVVVTVAGIASYLYVYRGGPDERRKVTGPGPSNDDR